MDDGNFRPWIWYFWLFGFAPETPRGWEMASLRNQQLLCSMLTVEKPCLCAQRSRLQGALCTMEFTRRKHSRQFQGPRIGGQLNKICCIQMMEYYSQLQGLT